LKKRGHGVRILHVAQPTDGGVSTIVRGLARFQAYQGDEVHLASPPGELPEQLRPHARWHEWRATRQPGWQVVDEVRRLARIIAEVDPEIVHLHSAKAGLCGRLAIRGRRATVFQPHGWSFLAVSGPMASLVRGWERVGARWASAVVCVSADEKSVGRAAGVEHSRYVICANSVRTETFGGLPRARARDILGLPQEKVIVLSVARLSREKGVDQLLQSWERVRALLPHVLVQIVGDGAERDALAMRGAEFPEVTFVGARSDVPVWFSASDLFVLPSRYEGMAVTPLEAMAAGRSVVGFGVSGFAESLGPVKEADPVVPPGDTDALARAILRRLVDPDLRNEEGRRNLEHVRAHHDAAPAGMRMRRLYSELLQDT
jgi:glycosyltransferase involved in cell wall biosynthesis